MVATERPGGTGRDPTGELLAFFGTRRLSPTHRRIARYIAEHAEQAMFASSIKVANAVGVSQPSVARLATALGYTGYPEFQQALREMVLRGGAAPAGRNQYQAAVDAEIRNLETLREVLADAGRVAALGRELAGSHPLGVLGLRASRFLADDFRFFAAKVHPDVRALAPPVDDALLQLAGAGGTWVLAFVMPRYPRGTLDALAAARDLGLRTLVVTDARAARVERLADELLTVPVGTRLVFDSRAAAHVLAIVLTDAMAEAGARDADKRLERFERMAAARRLFLNG